MLSEVTEFAIYISLIVVGLMQVVKTIELFDKKFLPVVSIFLGILLAFGFIGFHFLSILIGIIAGLISMGLYDTGKSIKK